MCGYIKAYYETLENGVGNAEMYLIDTKKDTENDKVFSEESESFESISEDGSE